MWARFRHSLWLQALFVSLAWAALYLPGLATRELQGEEARRILPARTMLQTDEWMVPRSAGEVYNRKPPLINWCIAASIAAHDRMDEWTVRLPSTLAMLMLALGVLVLTRQWLGREGAFLAACMAMSSIGVIEKGRIAEIESLYIALYGLAITIWLAAWWKDRRWLAWCGGGLVLGIGFLAKGPVHVWYYYAVILGVLWAEGSLKRLLSLPHAVGLTLFFLPWLPWAMANAGQNPEGDSVDVWITQITHRLGMSEFDAVNWLLQIPQSLINLLPWVLLLPLLWNRSIVSQWEGLGRRGLWLKGLRAGLLVGFLVIALLPSSRPRFMLPMNLIAIFLMVECLALSNAGQVLRWGRRWLAFLMGAGILLLVAVWASPFIEPRSMVLPWNFMIGMTLLIALLLFRFHDLRKGSELGARTLVIATLCWMGFQLPLLSAAILVRTTDHDELRPFASELQQFFEPDQDVVLYKLPERMWPFYLGRRCYEIASLEELPDHAEWVMVEEEKLERRRGEMSRRFGEVRAEHRVQEPVTGNAGGKGEYFVLLGFGAKSDTGS